MRVSVGMSLLLALVAATAGHAAPCVGIAELTLWPDPSAACAGARIAASGVIEFALAWAAAGSPVRQSLTLSLESRATAAAAWEPLPSLTDARGAAYVGYGEAVTALPRAPQPLPELWQLGLDGPDQPPAQSRLMTQRRDFQIMLTMPDAFALRLIATLRVAEQTGERRVHAYHAVRVIPGPRASGRPLEVACARADFVPAHETLILPLDSGEVTVSGVVSDQQLGLPVEGAIVTAARGAPPVRAVTGPDGRYSLRIAAGGSVARTVQADFALQSPSTALVVKLRATHPECVDGGQVTLKTRVRARRTRICGTISSPMPGPRIAGSAVRASVLAGPAEPPRELRYQTASDAGCYVIDVALEEWPHGTALRPVTLELGQPLSVRHPPPSSLPAGVTVSTGASAQERELLARLVTAPDWLLPALADVAFWRALAEDGGRRGGGTPSLDAWRASSGIQFGRARAFIAGLADAAAAPSIRTVAACAEAAQDIADLRRSPRSASAQAALLEGLGVQAATYSPREAQVVALTTEDGDAEALLARLTGAAIATAIAAPRAEQIGALIQAGGFPLAYASAPAERARRLAEVPVTAEALTGLWNVVPCLERGGSALDMLPQAWELPLGWRITGVRGMDAPAALAQVGLRLADGYPAEELCAASSAISTPEGALTFVAVLAATPEDVAELLELWGLPAQGGALPEHPSGPAGPGGDSLVTGRANVLFAVAGPPEARALALETLTEIASARRPFAGLLAAVPLSSTGADASGTLPRPPESEPPGGPPPDPPAPLAAPLSPPGIAPGSFIVRAAVCSGLDAAGKPIGAGGPFAEGIKHVCLMFAYKNAPVDTRVNVTWYRGEQVVGAKDFMTGGTRLVVTRLSRRDGSPLLPGEYAAEITENGKAVTRLPFGITPSSPRSRPSGPLRELEEEIGG